MKVEKDDWTEKKERKKEKIDEERKERTRSIAQLVAHLPSMHEVLGSNQAQ